MKKPKITTLENGLTIVSLEHSGPSTTVMSLVSTGSHYEQSENNGISHFLEHMCFKGTEKQNGKDIMRYLDGLGAETNAFTSRELTGYYVKAIHKHWKKTLGVVADIYTKSLFPVEEIEKEKGVIIGEIAMYDDMPMYQVNDLFNSLVYGDQAAGRTVLGPKENIKKMTREQLLKYHGEHYVASATTVIIVGDITHDDVVKEVSKQFRDISEAKKLTKGKVLVCSNEPKLAIKSKKTDQTHLVLGYVSEKKSHKDTIVINMIGTLLGGGMSSRLFERLREDLGVGYYVQAKNNAKTDIGVFEISCGIDSLRTAEVLGEIQNEINRIKNEKISETELTRVREYIIGNIQMGLESSDDVAYFYGKQCTLGFSVQTPKDIINAYKNVSGVDIKRVAKKIFKNERLSCALVGPHTEKEREVFMSSLVLK